MTFEQSNPINDIRSVRAFCTSDWRFGLRLEGDAADTFQGVLRPQALADLERLLRAYKQLRAEEILDGSALSS
jgi:hypothetical protein